MSAKKSKKPSARRRTVVDLTESIVLLERQAEYWRRAGDVNYRGVEVAKIDSQLAILIAKREKLTSDFDSAAAKLADISLSIQRLMKELRINHHQPKIDKAIAMKEKLKSLLAELGPDALEQLKAELGESTKI